MSVEIPVDHEGQPLFKPVGTIRLKDIVFLFGVRQGEMPFLSYSLLDTTTGMPIATRDLISLHYSSFWPHEIYSKAPYIEDISGKNVKEYIEGKSDMAIACTGITITLHPLTENASGPVWGWQLRIKHEVSDDILEKMRITRAELIQDLERFVTHEDMIPSRVLQEVYEELTGGGKRSESLDETLSTTREVTCEVQTPELQEHQKPSTIRAVVTLTDKELETGLKTISSQMNKAIEIFDDIHPIEN